MESNYSEHVSLSGVGRWELTTNVRNIRIVFTPDNGEPELWEGKTSDGWRRWEEIVENVRQSMR